ncbi:type VI secretion system tip protein VgrG [Undibacterium cyanobacteriorum]|uniref:Type VI secretion system tip protein VgrG n=1 Tax=Undibacterium cyanobacteriorum TaxID=3073561 RepID=A0ABY9RH06_9BURK|nr:type VI secretion system tip protein VgrG [Undibacterium sp. 20NA77.5]WMW80508.1 type VI secretion system tip protein VgrG [Undibacterium sp. 20NA77.5]
MADSPLNDSSGVLSFTITCDGEAMPDLVQVVSIETQHSINRIPTALITIIDGDMPNAEFPVADAGNFKPGTEVVISAGYEGTVKQIFQGIVIKHSVKITGDNYARLLIECRDKALAMTVGRKNANYVDKKDSDIITTLIGAYSGLTADVEATTITYKELVQYYSTDWDYMMARAEANGLLVTIDASKVTVKSPRASDAAVLTLTYGHDLMEFHADLDARWQLNSVTSTSWDLATLKIVQQTATPATLTGQGDIASKTLAEILNVSDFGLQTAAPLESGALTAWSKAQQTKAAMSRIQGRMQFQGSALAKPGVVLELAAVGKHFNGNVIASTVIHRLQDGNWITEVEFGMPSYWFTEEHHLQAPEAAGLTAGISGLHIGIVMKLDADPEGQYKIQVDIPLMNADTVGVWARLASFYASSGFGSFVIPEIGDEVVLGFFNNDPSCPVILGSLYSSKHTPPYELTADNNIKAMVTRSKLKMEYDDGKKVITLITPANNKIVISDDSKSILLQDQNNNKVELSSSGILLDSPKDITIKALGKVVINATQNIEATAQMDVKVTGLNITNTANVGFTAKGTATAELSAAGQTTVKGAMVMIN